MLPPDFDGGIIIGKRKKGKTTLSEQLMCGEPRVITYDAKGELREPYVIEPGTPLENVRLPSHGVYRAYIPCRGEPAEEVEYSAYIAAHLGRCVLRIDELADALEGGDPQQWMRWVVRMGRKRDVRYLCSYQRPQEAARMFTSQASDWWLHQTNEPNELLYIRQSVSAEAAEYVRNLKRGESVHVKDGVVVDITQTHPPHKHTR